MAANTSPIFGLTAKTQATAFLNADGTTVKAIYVAGANGSLILGINAVTSDTAANDVNLYIKIGGAGSFVNIGGKRVAIASGKVVASTIPSVQLLDVTQIPTVLADGTYQLGSLDVLGAGVVAAVTSPLELDIVVQAQDY